LIIGVIFAECFAVTDRRLVGDVSALREIYEPALLDDATSTDAQQTIVCVAVLVELVEEIANSNFS
jgi:hypothetical protein